ncbi:hypothetical protein [Oricola sp.]|uniref:hypothetical protein n=1 Tax=Oricola sp. TaxID=1979950 RepID=UPI0025F95E48|nr:hypothetical protein [Oricola sp.]MCI5077247.1 hypothetical protein [Oricola sp.]
MTDPQGPIFDWQAAIDRNREALLRIVAVLFVRAGLDEGGADQVTRRAWRIILRVLRPAESAARRLIVIAARSIDVGPLKPLPPKEPTALEQLQAAGLVITHTGLNLGLARMWQPQPDIDAQPAEPRAPAFALTDPPRRFDPKGWDGWRPFPSDGFDLADDHEEVSAEHLCARLKALKRALEDIDGHARRLARLQARRAMDLFAPASKAQLKGATNKRATQQMLARPRRPLRHGWPPGHRTLSTHRVDSVLRECHGLALQALRADTS